MAKYFRAFLHILKSIIHRWIHSGEFCAQDVSVSTNDLLTWCELKMKAGFHCSTTIHVIPYSWMQNPDQHSVSLLAVISIQRHYFKF